MNFKEVEKFLLSALKNILGNNIKIVTESISFNYSNEIIILKINNLKANSFQNKYIVFFQVYVIASIDKIANIEENLINQFNINFDFSLVYNTKNLNIVYLRNLNIANIGFNQFGFYEKNFDYEMGFYVKKNWYKKTKSK